MREPKLFSRVRASGKTYWYVKIGKRHVALGDDADAAAREYHRLMLERRLSHTPKASRSPLLSSLVGLFLDWAEKKRKAATYREHNRLLMNFLAANPPDMRASEIKRATVRHWLDSHEEWGDGGRRAAIGSLSAFLNWCVEEEAISFNPIARMKRPPKGSRDTVIDDQQRARILAAIAADPPFLDLFTITAEQGVRPHEVRDLEARHLDLSAGVARLPREEHKTGGKTGKPRVIYLTPTSIAILSRLAKERPSGPLLRDESDLPWTRHKVYSRFRGIRRKLKDLPAGTCPYAMRHTYITDALAAGFSDAMVAELAGHTDPTMIQRTYGHLRKRPKAMKEAAAKLSLFPPVAAEGSADAVRASAG